MEKTALVLGATGGIGGAIAQALLRHGWQVKAMARKVPADRVPADRTGIEWLQGDAMNAIDVLAAAQGVDAIVHAVNPPGYRNWETLVLPMLDNTITAARAVGARIVLPGTVYNFNPAEAPLVDGDTPQRPANRKGAIRVEMERRLEQAAPVRALIVRAGDFFGPGARSSWFAQGMVKPGKPVTRIMNIAKGAGHSWAYLPDLAEAFARLMDAEDRLQTFERVQFAGLVDDTGTRMIDAIRQAAGRDVPVWRFPWWAMKLAGVFGGFPREVAEIEPFWRYPMRFDNSRLAQLIGFEPRTPLGEAMRATLADMGCLPAPELPIRAETICS